MMPDREKVIKGLECCIKLANVGCKECPYENSCFHGGRSGRLLKDALALLKEQDAVVRCKDCKYWSAERINDYNKCRRWINVGVKNFATMGDWFCADGERKEGR